MLGVTAGVQLAVFVLSGSVALLADLIHNVGDALTAVPLGIAFLLRSFRVSLGVVASAVIVSLGAKVGDPIIGLLITLVILKITWDSWRTVSTTDPGEMVAEPRDH